MDFENQDKEKDSNSSSGSFGGNSSNNSKAPMSVNFHACRRILIISVTQFIHWVQDVRLL